MEENTPWRLFRHRTRRHPRFRWPWKRTKHQCQLCWARSVDNRGSKTAGTAYRHCRTTGVSARPVAYRNQNHFVGASQLLRKGQGQRQKPGGDCNRGSTTRRL